MQLSRVILPARFAHHTAARRLAREAVITKTADGAWKIELPERSVCFFWPRQPDPNLHFVIEQEFSPCNPHHYTDAPISLSGQGTVIDVGACEGLFAFRALKNKLAARAVCFEPNGDMAELIQRGAEANGVRDRLSVEIAGVGKTTGQARMIFDEHPDAGRLEYIVEGDDADGAVDLISIDDYCQTHGMELSHHDLIKIDAEGADLDVLLGAENQIRNGAPQLAVTTYHVDNHAERMILWLRALQPDYRLRLKGFSFWTGQPRPVLLQASTLSDRK